MVAILKLIKILVPQAQEILKTCYSLEVNIKYQHSNYSYNLLPAVNYDGRQTSWWRGLQLWNQSGSVGELISLYILANIRNEVVEIQFKIYVYVDTSPSVGSCHHGMARHLGCGWGSKSPDMEVSCEYIE